MMMVYYLRFIHTDSDPMGVGSLSDGNRLSAYFSV